MSKLANKLYIKGLMARDQIGKFLKNERGEANIIAIILVLAIVIALAIIFRKAIGNLFNSIWDGITNDVGNATQGY